MASSFERAIFSARRLLVERLGLFVATVAALHLWLGEFRQLTLSVAQWPALVVAGVVAALLALRALVGRAPGRSKVALAFDRFELGLLLLVAVYVLIQRTGGGDLATVTAGSWAQPLAYLAVVFLVGVSTRAVGLSLAGAALALQLSVELGFGAAPPSALGIGVRCGALVVFSLASLLLLQAEIARYRREHQRKLAQAVRAMREDAREFRLISTSLTSSSSQQRAHEESKLARGAVEAIHEGMFFILELLKQALDLQTCVLLWLDNSGERLRIKELVTDSNMVSETAIPAQAGALGGIVKNRLLINLSRPRNGARGIPYYSGPEEIGAFVGVPVVENGHLRGVLCADRREDCAFSREEEKLLADAASQVLRAIQNERVFSAVERSKYEHERFYRASEMLNGALTLAQVYDIAFAGAREIVDFDFGALTLYDATKRTHTICRVAQREERSDGHIAASTPKPQHKLEGQIFGANAGLVAMVVKNKHFLPAGEGRSSASSIKDMVVFTRKLKLSGMGSLVVLPLIVQDHAIGTVVLGARETGRFPTRIREMLGVICNQVAVSIENAKMYKRMEEMATTDGLTALPNHRTFQARFSEMLNRAERTGKPVSLVLTDVDKFKNVNDTYGHPVGDAVLKRVARVLAEQVRKIDLVARYGGEEFVMVLEETDADGARLLCERVRKEVAAQVMSSDKGPFRVTLSLGVASYPTDGEEKVDLIERSDQALYHAKQTGRNRTVLWRATRSQRKAAATK